jgi:hypothetical protein
MRRPERNCCLSRNEFVEPRPDWTRTACSLCLLTDAGGRAWVRGIFDEDRVALRQRHSVTKHLNQPPAAAATRAR